MVALRREFVAAFTLAAVGAAGRTEAAYAPSAQEREAYARYEADLRKVLLRPGGQAAAAAGQASVPSACPFLAGSAAAESVPSEECMSCHGLHQTHPVDIDYASASGRMPGMFRAPAEVVRRGVYLPDGQVKCTTCHDPRSTWKYKLALPPGAEARPAVVPGVPSTYGDRGRKAAARPLPAGSAVTPTPLCLACHAYD